MRPCVSLSKELACVYSEKLEGEFSLQGLVFCVGLESGIIKLYDIRCFDQGPFATFLVS